MKKILLGIGVVIIAGLVLGTTGLAHAQEVSVGTSQQELPAESAAALKGALDVLGETLTTLQASLESNNEAVIASAPQITSTLGVISQNLQSLDTNLVAISEEPSSIVEQQEAVPQEEIVQTEEANNNLLASAKDTSEETTSGWLSTAQWIVAILVILGIGSWIWFSNAGRSKTKTTVAQQTSNTPSQQTSNQQSTPSQPSTPQQ